MEYKLPRPWLSYSAIDLWCKDKDRFRRKYYLGEKDPDNAFTKFGRAVHQELETDETLSHIPRYPVAELEVKVEIEGIPLMGYIDGFDPKSNAFLDYKSSIRNKDGSSKWNDVAVQKLNQLPFYSMMIEKKYGQVHPEAKLIWLETQWKENNSMLVTKDELELTGHFETFTREIEPWERERIKEWVVEKAEEISKDYLAFTG